MKTYSRWFVVDSAPIKSFRETKHREITAVTTSGSLLVVNVFYAAHFQKHNGQIFVEVANEGGAWRRRSACNFTHLSVSGRDT